MKLTRYIKQLCSLGVQGQGLIPIILPELQKMLQSHGSTFFWVDDSFQVSNIYDENIYKHEFNYKYIEHILDCVNTPEWFRFSHQILGLDVVDPLVLEGHRNSYRTIFHANTLNSLKYQQTLLGCVRYGGRLKGMLLLHRSANEHKYSERDKALVSEILPLVGEAIQNSREQDPEAPRSLGNSGLIFLTQSGKVVSTCAKGRELLFMMNNPTVSLADLSNNRYECQPPNHVDLQLAASPSKNGPVNSPDSACWKYKNVWGEFLLRANPLQQDICVAGEIINVVTAQMYQPLAINIIQRSRELLLTQKQTEICIPLVAGYTYDEISAQQHISKHTVVSHIKSIFNKLNLNNQVELVMTLTNT